MAVKQISIFVENQPGRLARVTRCLADAGVNIRALCVADTADFGILRLIVSDTDKAVEALKSRGCSVTVCDVIAVALADKPGSLAKVAEILAADGISVEYLYAFLTPNAGKAFLILRVDDNEKSVKALKREGIEVEEKLDD